MPSILRSSLCLLLLIFMITSCDDEPGEKKPGELKLIVAADEIKVEQGKTLKIDLSLTASDGIRSFTVNDTPYENLDLAQTNQTVTYNHGIPLDAVPGPVTINFRLEDTEGNFVTESLNFEIIERETAFENFTLSDNAAIISDNAISSVQERLITLNSVEHNYEAGDIIAGGKDGGFIRKVTSKVKDGNTTYLHTEPALLTDLFETADLEFDLGNNAAGRAKESFPGADLEYSFNKKLVEEGESFLAINGSIKVRGNYSCKISIDDHKLTFASFAISQTVAELDLTSTIHSAQSVQAVDQTYELYSTSKTFSSISPPLFGNINLKVKAKINSTITASLTATAHAVKKVQFDAEVFYRNGQWGYSNNLIDLSNEATTEIEGAVAINNIITIIPEMDMTLYGIAGPYFHPGFFAELNMGANDKKDWDAKLDLGYNGKYGLRVGLFGFQADYEQKIEEKRENFWKGPSAVKAYNGQREFQGTPHVPLQNAIKVTVFDNADNPMAFVPVYFTIVSGTGFLHLEKVTTDDHGTAGTTVTPESGMEIRATIKDRYGIAIKHETFFINSFEFSVTELPGSEDDVFYYGEKLKLGIGGNYGSFETKWYADGKALSVTRDNYNGYDVFDYSTQHLSVGQHQFQCKVFSSTGELIKESGLLPVTTVFIPVHYWNYFPGATHKAGDRVYLGLHNSPFNNGNSSFYSTSSFKLIWHSNIQGELSAINRSTQKEQFDTYGLAVGVHQITAGVYHPVTGDLINVPNPPITITVNPLK